MRARGFLSRALLLGLPGFLPCTPARAEMAVEPALSVEAGSPQKLSANLGIRLASGPDAGAGFLLQAQPGLGGGALNVGWMPISFAAHRTQALGAGIKARLLRTWGSPWGLEAGHSYAGFEAVVAVGFKASFGVLWKLDSGAGRRSVVTWSVGVGL